MASKQKNRCGLVLGVLMIGLLTWTGCGDNGPRMAEISGTVTYQGQPIKEGKIFFADANNAVGTAAGNIKDGHYEVQVLPGEKCVRINAPHKTGRVQNGPMGVQEEEIIDLIPPKYNSNSKLVCTVAPEGKKPLDFALK